MSTSTNARIDFRIRPEQKALIERAAGVKGQTVTDFAVTALVEAAQETIERAAKTTLSARDADIFLRILASSGTPNRALRSAARRYRKSRG